MIRFQTSRYFYTAALTSRDQSFSQLCSFKIESMDHTIPQEHSMSQEVKTCEISAAAQLQIFCNNCQISLCGKCDTEHRKGGLCGLHDKVLFPDLNKLLFPSCTIHQDQICNSYCKQCDIPVCNKCKTQTHHDHHELIEMAHFVSTKLNEIKAEIEELF